MRSSSKKLRHSDALAEERRILAETLFQEAMIMELISRQKDRALRIYECLKAYSS